MTGEKFLRGLFTPIDPKRIFFLLAYSPVRRGGNKLAVNSRSMVQIMNALSSWLEVPEAHLKEHGALPGFENSAPENRRDKARIHSGKDKPVAAFTAVRYRGHWFWIEEGDWQTKRALAAVMFFFALAETGDQGGLPLITIPAQ